VKITQVDYQATINLGNYENERIGLKAQLEEGDTPDQAIAQLRNRVIEMTGPDNRGYWRRRFEEVKVETEQEDIPF
jgi:hypothetical protein